MEQAIVKPLSSSTTRSSGADSNNASLPAVQPRDAVFSGAHGFAGATWKSPALFSFRHLHDRVCDAAVSGRFTAVSEEATVAGSQETCFF